MKKIETIVHAQNWDQTRAALETLHVSATLREIKTFGRTPPRREVYRGSPYMLETTPELEMTVFVQDELLESTLAALSKVAGDSEFLVTTVERVVSGRDAKSPIAAAAQRAGSAACAVAAPAFLAAMTRG